MDTKINPFSGEMDYVLSSTAIKEKLSALSGADRLDASAIKNLPESGGGSDTIQFPKITQFKGVAPVKMFGVGDYYYVGVYGDNLFRLWKYDEYMNRILDFETVLDGVIDEVVQLSDSNLIIRYFGDNSANFQDGLIKVDFETGKRDATFDANCPDVDNKFISTIIKDDVIFYGAGGKICSVNADGTVNSSFSPIVNTTDYLADFKIVGEHIYVYEKTETPNQPSGLVNYDYYVVNRYDLTGSIDPTFSTITSAVNGHAILEQMQLFGLMQLHIMNNGDVFWFEVDMSMNFSIIRLDVATGNKIIVSTTVLTPDAKMPYYSMPGKNRLYITWMSQTAMSNNNPTIAELKQSMDIIRYNCLGEAELDILDNFLDCHSISMSPDTDYLTNPAFFIIPGRFSGMFEISDNTIACIMENANQNTGLPMNGDVLLGNIQLVDLDGNPKQVKPYFESSLSVLNKVFAGLDCKTGDMIIARENELAKLTSPTSPSVLKHTGVVGELPYWESV